MKKSVALGFVMLCGMVIAQAQSSTKLEKLAIRQTVQEVANLLERNYVSREKGQQMKTHLLNNLKKGVYDKLTEPERLAEQLKGELQAICNDKHVYLNVLDPKKDKLTKPQASAISYNKKAAAFQDIKILPGNIGYIEITHFLPTEVAATDAMATMNYLAKSDAIIFDLRKHRGGNGEMVQIILSYLFDKPTLINTVYDRINDTTYQIWTHKVVTQTQIQEYDAKMNNFVTIDSTSVGSMVNDLTKADVYVLTSDFTFSAGEEFVYDLKSQKRGTIIGSTTGAGGNPTRFYPVNENFAVSIPWAKSINPITKEGWEGVGVTPDIDVHPAKALETAHILAINKLMEKAPSKEAKDKLSFDMEVAKALYHKIEVPENVLQKYTGDYEGYRILLEEGILYSKKGRSGKLPLFAIAPHTFSINEDSKIVFSMGESGEITGLEVQTKSGGKSSYKKK